MREIIDKNQLTDLLFANRFSPSNFIEIGSRDGHDTNHIQKYWSLDEKQCYIIEAHPTCYENIKKTYPQYNVHNFAASNEYGIVKFNAGIIGREVNIGLSSVLENTIGPFIFEQVDVRSIRMDSLMDLWGIDGFDFMKIDVEGFAFQVLDGFGDKLRNTKYIQVELEYNTVWKNQVLYGGVLDFLSNKGFKVLHEGFADYPGKDVLLVNNNI
jgi:FkbM family methyltransferase